MPLATMRTTTSSGRGSSSVTLRTSKSLNFSGTTAAVISMVSRRLFRYGCLQDRAKTCDFLLHHRRKRFRAAILLFCDFGAEVRESFAHGRIVETLVERVGKLVDHRLRRALRCIDR